ncbi:hypothetical protein KFU94_25555 [Chloroflexi bacterium TSY]|nr:hypothetical protein [Chloroflexi bacterium TSY]
MSKTTRIQRGSRTIKFAIATAIGTTLFALGRWYTLPASKTPEGTLLDYFLPNAEFNGHVSVTIHAPPKAIFQAIRRVTLADMPVAKFMGELRYLPSRLTGKRAEETLDTEPFMDVVLAEVGNIVLTEVPNQELIVGGIGKYQNLLDQQIVPLQTPTEFMDFDQPEYQKLAMSFRVAGSDPTAGCNLTLEHRTHALSSAARWKFALYWLGIKPGGNFVSWLLLRAIKRRAEIMVTDEAFAQNSSG